MADLGEVLDRAVAEGRASIYAVAAVKLLLFTGARRGEILSLNWDHFDLERRILALPDSKTGAKLVGLSAPAVDVLAALPRVAGNRYVIVGDRPGRHIVNLTKPWRRLRALAGLSDLRLHDLRRNYGSRAASTGHALPIVAKQMGHTQIATTAKYAHAMPDPVRQMNEAIGEQLAHALGRGRTICGVS
jgi:integrase